MCRRDEVSSINILLDYLSDLSAYVSISAISRRQINKYPCLKKATLLIEVDSIIVVYYHPLNDLTTPYQNFKVIHVVGVFRYNGRRAISIRDSLFIFGRKNVRRNKNEIRCRLWGSFTIYDNRQILVQRIQTRSFINF